MLDARMKLGARLSLAIAAAGALALGCGKKSDGSEGATPAPAATPARTTVRADAGVRGPAKPPWCRCSSLTSKPAPGGCIPHATCTATGVSGWYCTDGKSCACGPSLDGCN